jgi:hypothetical protein
MKAVMRFWFALLAETALFVNCFCVFSFLRARIRILM